MKVLAIETSCDETGIAIVEGTKTEKGLSFRVLKHALLSQAALHAQFGGVYPNLAKREHEKNLPVLFEEFKNDEVDALAVTHGPGLEPTLWSGITFAQKLARERRLPLIPTNHMEGHLISSLVREGKLEHITLPILALLVSGGHTELVVMREWFHYEVIGQTFDDAVGEAFDKVARMLGLPYPGGPEISKLAAVARGGSVPLKNSAGWTDSTLTESVSLVHPVVHHAHREDETRSPSATSKPPVAHHAHREDETRSPSATSKPPGVRLPRPMLHTDNCDFSFSGLKTAVLYALRDRGGIQKLSVGEVTGFAREFEDAVTEVLVSKVRRALLQTGAKTFVLGGGVAANTHIRKSLQKLIASEFDDIELRLPKLSITGDNAIMIAEAALARSLAGVQTNPPPDSIRAHGSLSISTQK